MTANPLCQVHPEEIAEASLSIVKDDEALVAECEKFLSSKNPLHDSAISDLLWVYNNNDHVKSIWGSDYPRYFPICESSHLIVGSTGECYGVIFKGEEYEYIEEVDEDSLNKGKAIYAFIGLSHILESLDHLVESYPNIASAATAVGKKLNNRYSMNWLSIK
jgi:hypothetical protein